MGLKSSDIFSDVRFKKMERDFLKLSGNDALRFLQGMWTSDVQLMNAESLTATRSLLLSLKARPFALATLVLDKREESKPFYWISVPAGTSEEVFGALDKYLVADDVEIEVLAAAKAPFEVYTVWGSSLSDVKESRLPPRVAADPATVYRAKTIAEAPSSLLIPVGRIHASAHELWLSKGKEGDFVSQISASSNAAEEYTKLRVENGVPEWGVDFDQDSLVLEYPFGQEISFHKGCYIGQEVVARGSYRGRVAKSFVRFRAESDLSPAYVYDAEDTADENAKPVGKITTVSGQEGLGQLRLRDFESKKFELRSDGKTVPIKTIDLLALKVPD